MYDFFLWTSKRLLVPSLIALTVWFFWAKSIDKKLWPIQRNNREYYKALDEGGKDLALRRNLRYIPCGDLEFQESVCDWLYGISALIALPNLIFVSFILLGFTIELASDLWQLTERLINWSLGTSCC